MATTKLGCGRTVLLSLGVLAAFVLGTAAWYWSTVATMYDNMRAMNEGAAAAEALHAPEDVLDYLARHPGDASLVAFDTAEPEAGLYFQADSARPVAGVARLLVLAEFARQAAEGTLDPEARVGPEAFAPYALRGRPDSLLQAMTLGAAARRMMQRGDQAAADLLIRRLGRANLSALPERLGLPEVEAPLPKSGTHLSWQAGPVAAPGSVRGAFADSAHALTERLETDAAFREAVAERRQGGQATLSLRKQRTLAQATYPRGTAAAYAVFLRDVLTDSLLSEAVSRRVRSAIERPLPGDARGVVGSKAGSFPGLISFAGYVRHADRPGGRVVALLVEGVPMGVFYHFAQTGLDNVFELRLLLDDAFFQHARQRLGGPVPSSFAAAKAGAS